MGPPRDRLLGAADVPRRPQEAKEAPNLQIHVKVIAKTVLCRCPRMPRSTDRTTHTVIARPGSSEVEAIYDKIARRIMPFLVLLFVVAWLDRINVGFARPQMVEDLRFQRRGLRIRCRHLLPRLPAIRDS